MRLAFKVILLLIVSVLATTLFLKPSSAQEKGLLSIGTGWYDFNDNRDAVDIRIEYRSNTKYLKIIKPWVGIQLTTDNAAYGLTGILSDIYASKHIIVTPSFGIGFYSDGNGKDLGNTIEFRSQLELGYEFNDKSRVSAAVSHISNAHLSDQNPGTEIFNIYYHIPLKHF
ncbi:MAG: acyloxyacyl hydrolase [Alphaproteobacteria bacterium]